MSRLCNHLLPLLCTVIGLLPLTVAGPVAAQVSESDVRAQANRKIHWQATRHSNQALDIKLLTINDFHSNINAGEEVDGRPVGSAPVLAAYLKDAQARAKGATFILHAGDHVGASQPQSTLLQDEPGIQFFNLLGNRHCRVGEQRSEACNLIGIPGNHELDKGLPEMLRLLNGGNHAQGPFLQQPYPGAAYPTICANLVQAGSRQPLLPPYVVKEINGVKIGFIGAILHRASSFLSPESLAGLEILDEAATLNAYARQLQAEGVHTLVALLHQGGFQIPARSGTPSRLAGDLLPIIERLDQAINVVVAGHTHTFHNILVNHDGHRPTLVVQAWPKGTGYADIDLKIDRQSGEVVAMAASIVTTWADCGPGLHPERATAQLAQRVDALGKAIAAQVITQTAKPITRLSSAAGESALGDLVADAQRQVMGTDFAFMHPDGIQADFPSGNLTKGDPFTVQPANLNLIKLDMTGQQIYDLLNQQWSKAREHNRVLQVSGLTYTWDARRPAGQRVISVLRHGTPIDRAATYTVAVNEYLAGGGDDFTTLTKGANPVVGPFIAEALSQYMQTIPQPIHAAIEGRISRLN